MCLAGEVKKQHRVLFLVVVVVVATGIATATQKGRRCSGGFEAPPQCRVNHGQKEGWVSHTTTRAAIPLLILVVVLALPSSGCDPRSEGCHSSADGPSKCCSGCSRLIQTATTTTVTTTTNSSSSSSSSSNSSSAGGGGKASNVKRGTEL
jgi:hypothetical protein